MSGKELFEAMSYVEERFVEEAEIKSLPKRGTSLWVKAASVAACLCLIAVGLTKMNLYGEQNPTVGAMDANAADQASPQQDTLYGIPSQTQQNSQSTMISPAGEPPASRAPEQYLRVVTLTETGFIGIVEETGGFGVFDVHTKLNVTIDPRINHDYAPGDYKTGSLVRVIYTSWDENGKTVAASILGIVDEPNCD